VTSQSFLCLGGSLVYINLTCAAACLSRPWPRRKPSRPCSEMFLYSLLPPRLLWVKLGLVYVPPSPPMVFFKSSMQSLYSPCFWHVPRLTQLIRLRFTCWGSYSICRGLTHSGLWHKWLACMPGWSMSSSDQCRSNIRAIRCTYSVFQAWSGGTRQHMTP